MNLRLAVLIFSVTASTLLAQDAPRPPKEAARHIKVPPGFKVTLFAGEPDVVQPIACTFDDRGRMWVVECFSYPKPDPNQKDRVVVFTDTDGDGQFDKRKVFWEQGNNTTGIALGYGGVWLSATPHLLFIPDKNRDDVPDGEPEVMLDGWDEKAQHNLFNALSWAPDGWLWGCNGILSNSKVGRPGAADDKRVDINCGVWRFHPTRHEFEAVAHGTTNPWGLDFDDYGQAFITNCVIHHLWHVVPGSRFERMFGQDFNQHTYKLLSSCADHLHWAGGHWTESRGNQPQHSDAGGGHAHSGAMIYLGDNWSDEYRNHVFMANIHGARLNQDELEHSRSGYVAHHGRDIFTVDDPWFRGVYVTQGPDGAAYVLDWSDTGECHDYEEVDRRNGRIFRLSYGDPNHKQFDLQKLSDLQLAEIQLSKNDWFVRRARLLLAERAAERKIDASAVQRLLDILGDRYSTTRRLRALWALHGLGQPDVWNLRALMEDKDEHVRAWAVRLELEDKSVQWPGMATLVGRANEDPSPVVRLALASGLQRLPVEQRWAISEPLAGHAEDADDPTIPLMLWYAIEPLPTVDRARAVSLISRAKIPLVREFLARRIAGLRPPDDRGARSADDPLNLLASLARNASQDVQLDVLRGMNSSLSGRRSVTMPAVWPETATVLRQDNSGPIAELSLRLSVLFDEPAAIQEARKMVNERSLEVPQRERAIEMLIQKRDAELPAMLAGLLGDSGMSSAALKGLAAFEESSTPKLILDRYKNLTESQRQDAIATLASRPSFAVPLLESVRSGDVSRQDVSTFMVRQLGSIEDPHVRRLVGEMWGEVRATREDKKRQIDELRAKLAGHSPSAADAALGRQVFAKQCASCHRMYDAGEKVGPDLTGSQRKNLDYVLENVVDPSAVVARDYQVTLVQTEDGRVLNGIVVEENQNAVTLQTINERVIVPLGEIENRKQAGVSLMPDDLLSRLSVDEIRALIAYLATDQQVPLKE